MPDERVADRFRRRQSRQLDDPLSHHRTPRHGDDGVVSRRLIVGALAAAAPACACGALARCGDRQGAVRAQLGLGAILDQSERRPGSALRRAVLRRRAIPQTERPRSTRTSVAARHGDPARQCDRARAIRSTAHQLQTRGGRRSNARSQSRYQWTATRHALASRRSRFTVWATAPLACGHQDGASPRAVAFSVSVCWRKFPDQRNPEARRSRRCQP